MLSKKENQLIELQEIKIKLFSKIEKQLQNNQKINAKNHQEMTEIQDKMAKLNELDDEEKNIHAIWIGIPPKGELNYLKVWTKFNKKYKIHIWTDSTHILTDKLNNIISEYANITNNDEIINDYSLQAKLKDEFYYSYHLKNQTKTFDENAKQFLLNKGHASENEIAKWIKDGKEKLEQEVAEIKKYTTNEVILHDINQENDIFPTEKYKEGYLNTLEHLHLCTGASDRLRYAILNKFGGFYLDTDVMPKFNLEKIEKDQKINNLINSIKYSADYNTYLAENKLKIIINELFILDNLNQLNDENLEHFAKNWENIFKGNFNQNFEIFKQIAKQFKKMNLKPKPEMKLSEFPINNILQIGCYVTKEGDLLNCFLVSKKKSDFLQEIMKKIEVTDQKLKRNEKINTYIKLINKTIMLMIHTGNENLDLTIKENDSTYFYNLEKSSAKIITLENIHKEETNWNEQWYFSRYTITDNSMLNNLFWSNAEEVINYNPDKNKKNESFLYSKFMIEQRKKVK